MKVLFYIAGFGQGGAQNQCIYLINALSHMIDVHVVYHYEGENFSKIQLSKERLHQVATKSFYSINNIFRVSSVIQKIQPDILFSWLQSSDVYSYFLKGICKQKFLWVMAERDSSYPRFDPRFVLRNLLGRKATAIVANSTAGKEYWIRRGVNKDKIFYVPNIVNAISHGTYGTNKVYDVCYAGRFVEQKNVKFLLDVFIFLAKKHSTLKFLMVGDGPLKNTIVKTIEMEKLEEQIIVLPFTLDIVSLYAKSKVFINLSFHEGTPNTVIENININNILVLSRIDGHASLVGSSYPFFVDDLSSIELASSILYRAIQYDPRMIDFSFAFSVLSKSDSVSVANEYLNLFKEIL